MASLKDKLKGGLVDMKEDKEPSKCCAPAINAESDYPWGLRLTLNKSSLKKLGLDVSDFTVGDPQEFVASCEVIRIEQSSGDYESKTVELQIKKLKLSKDDK